MNANKSRALLHHPHKNQKKRAESVAPSLPAALLRGMLTALLLLPLFVLALSLAAYFTEDPVRLIPVCGVLCAYLFAFCGAAFTARHHKSRFLFCGLLVSLLQCALLLLFSLAFGGDSARPLLLTLLLYAGLFPMGLLGAYLGLPKQTGAKKKSRHPQKKR